MSKKRIKQAGAFSINFNNNKCKTKVKESQENHLRSSEYCFLVTNLYVYSLFGIIIGIVIIGVWYTKYKKIWSNRFKKIDK